MNMPKVKYTGYEGLTMADSIWFRSVLPKVVNLFDDSAEAQLIDAIIEEEQFRVHRIAYNRNIQEMSFITHSIIFEYQKRIDYSIKDPVTLHTIHPWDWERIGTGRFNLLLAKVEDRTKMPIEEFTYGTFNYAK